MRLHALGPHGVTKQTVPIQNNFLTAHLQGDRSTHEVVQGEIRLVHADIRRAVVGLIGKSSVNRTTPAAVGLQLNESAGVVVDFGFRLQARQCVYEIRVVCAFVPGFQTGTDAAAHRDVCRLSGHGPQQQEGNHSGERSKEFVLHAYLLQVNLPDWIIKKLLDLT